MNLEHLTRLTHATLMPVSPRLLRLPQSLTHLEMETSTPPQSLPWTMPSRDLALPKLKRLACDDFRGAACLLTRRSKNLNTASGFADIAPLEELEIHDCGLYSCGHSIHENLRDLHVLRLSRSTLIDDEEIAKIAQNSGSLRAVNFDQTAITGVGVRTLVTTLKDLKHLSVCGCVSLSRDAVDWARSKGVNITFEAGDHVSKSGRKIRWHE